MRTKRALFNLLTNILIQLVVTFSGLLLPRMIIREYGSAIYGLIASSRQFIAYAGLAEAGVAATSIYALYKPLYINSHNEINKIISTTKKFYIKTGKIFAFLIIVLSLLYPLIINEDIPSHIVSIMIIILASSSIMDYFFIGKYRVLLTADQKGYIISLLKSITIFVSTIISIFLIKQGSNILFVHFISALINVSNLFVVRRYVKKYYPFVNFNTQTDTQSVNTHWDALIHQIQGMIVANTPIILITIFFGLSEVSVYSIYYMVFGALGMIVLTFSNGLSPAFGQLLSTNVSETLLRAYGEFEMLFYIIITWAYTNAALLIIPFVKLYTFGINDADYIQPTLALMFVLVGIMNYIRVPQLTIVVAAGHFKETRNKAIIEVVLNVIGSLIFLKLFGVLGILIGSILSYSYRTIDFIFYTNNKILKRKPTDTFIILIRNILTGVIIYLSFTYLIKINILNWFDWLKWGVIISLVSMLVIVFINWIFSPIVIKRIVQRFSALF